MIEMILVYCMLSNGAVCREDHPLVEVAGLMDCMVQGQRVAADYLKEHPGLRLDRVRCEMGHRRERNA